MTSALKEGLDELRRELAKTTIDIVRAVGRRNELAAQVGRIKAGASLPIRDDSVEASLVRSVLDECDRTGVSRSAGLKILNELLNESMRVQGVENIVGAESPMSSFAKAVALQKKGRKLIRLDVGEPDFAPPRAVLEACSDALFSSKTHYTLSRGIPELVSALRAYLKRTVNVDLTEDQLLVTTGGRFAIYASIASVVGEGESAVVLDPNWPAYKQALVHIGAKSIVVRTTLEDGWEPSADEVNAAIQANTKAIIVSYPNNPSGKVLDSRTFRDLIRVANDNHLTVISDEAYSGYRFKECPSILESEAESFVLAGTFSKTWAMTGFRLGYAVSSKEIIGRMLGLVSLMLTSVPEFIQYGAIRALESEAEAQANRKTMQQRIDSVGRALDEIGSLRCYRPDGAMYFFPQCARDDFQAGAFANRLLEEKGVSVTPGTAFGDYPRSFRISLGQPADVLEEGVRKIGELLG